MFVIIHFSTIIYLTSTDQRERTFVGRLRIMHCSNQVVDTIICKLGMFKIKIYLIDYKI